MVDSQQPEGERDEVVDLSPENTRFIVWMDKGNVMDFRIDYDTEPRQMAQWLREFADHIELHEDISDVEEGAKP